MQVVAAYKGPAGPDVLAFASLIASDAPLQVVTVYPGQAPVGRGRVDGEWVAYNREEAERAARDGESTRLLEGPVVDALADLLPEDLDLLVCGSRGYGPARRVLLGGVSSRLLRHARVPVLVVPRA